MAKKLNTIAIRSLLLVFIFLPTIVMSQLHADFSANPLSGCPPMIINFTDSSAGDPTAWKWDFGNGTGSAVQNPVATYLNPGTYTVKLVIRNGRGIDSAIKSQYVVVNALPGVDFTASATTGCFPLKVNFTDRSLAGSGTITNWEWDFGDGTVSFEQNPLHIYTINGNFRVILKVTNSNGCVQFTSKSSYIRLKNGVQSNFEYTSLAGCHTPAPVNFINKSIGTGDLAFKWDFGDGITSKDPNPLHYYQNGGVYTVKLITTNSYGCTDTLIKPNAINIGFVKADFAKPDVACPGSAFQLTNTSNPSSYVGSFWDFGDGTFSTEANPLKSYSTSGNHQVKLVTDFGSCKDSIVKVMNVLPKPVVNFTGVNNKSCSAPLNVRFNNTTANSISYVWNFGDSSTSTLQNPAHTYLSLGSYTVSLVATSTNGCTDTAVKENFVKIVPPTISSIASLPVKGCLPLTIKPVPVFADSSLKVSSYFWDFGDGTTSKKAKPTHTYTTAGSFTVKLVIRSSGCTDSIVIVSAVKAGIKPIVAFGANSRNICASKSLKFTDRSTGGTVTEWLWNFGDGNTSIEQNPSHLYRDTGYFAIYLVATNYGCSDTLRKKRYIHVKPPVARFDTAFLCSSPLNRNFIDKSIGAKTWSWDLGDGTTSTAKKITHTYASTGSYPVSLIVTNGACSDTVKTDVVVIKEKGKLDVTNPVSCINTSVNFSVSNVNPSNIRSYAWYFNGITEPVAPVFLNPATTQYTEPGRYPAAAVITDILNCPDTLYPAAPITIYGAKANFQSSVPGACFGNTISFNDSTKTDGIHPVAKWLWNFGDGVSQTFTKPPFTHQYNNEGKFGVGLTVTDSYGCVDSIFKTDSLNIIKPVAKFIQSDTLICPNTTITFTNQTNGLNNIYHWQFGDGAISDSISPLHTYLKEGKYEVKLFVSNLYGCSDSLVSYINVVTTASGFAMSDTFVNCPPLTVNFTNTSIGFSQLEWDFDDDAKSTLINPSHIYTEPGTYRVKLLAKNNTGCSDTTSKVLVVKGPKGTFSYTPLTACTPGKVEFTANVQTAIKYLWNYQDGSTDSTIQNTSSHAYETAGLYLPKLIVEDSTGCRFVITGKDTIVANDLKTSILSDKNILCDTGTVHFSNNTLATEGGISYKWDFDDGAVSSLGSPEHTFTQPGNYNIVLHLTTPGGCTDSAAMLVKVVKTTIPSIIAKSNACSLDSVVFSVQLQNDTSSISKWSWNFGNGETSSFQFPPGQLYSSAGSYNTFLSVENSSGCISEVTKPIVINASPSLIVTPDTAICSGNSVLLSASGAASYQWGSPDNSLSCRNCANPTANPAGNITYMVKGSSAEGCSAVDSVTVQVLQPFNVSVSKDTAICRGQAVQLISYGAPNYLWSPSGGLSSVSVSNPVASPNTTSTYKVVGFDGMSCRSDTSSVTVTVYDNPTVDLGADKIISTRSSVVLTPAISNDAIRLAWSPSTGLSCSDCANPHFISTNNITYKLLVENEHCSAEDEIKIVVNYNNAKVVIPNAFSPNGDGINDVFYPTGNDASNVKSFTIYNRWGRQVFGVNNVSGNDPGYGWNGTVNGKPAEVGVYYYIIEVVGVDYKITKYAGYVTLLK
ncbi:T9SS C-terminal target domain-containing protein [Segetibacter koreensis]|uniref:T9SS C-terminal target domain-containing protein n=1 Tax=Segetibacter koreensis TaxID=398037 RepID=UPI0003604CEC|nr:T9SS C-terminal target domain-containing protein [Segetibacter koreensis]